MEGDNYHILADKICPLLTIKSSALDNSLDFLKNIAINYRALAHSKGFARRALLSGFQVHLPKPVDPVDLIAVVASLAGRIRGTRSPSADSESSPTPS